MKRCVCALLLTAVLIGILCMPSQPRTSIITTPQRQLLRIWSVSSIGGSDSWLKKQLQQFEKRNPGVMTYLRTVAPDELTAENAVLPDLILYTPGTIAAPQDLFTPISGTEMIREELLRASRWQDSQYALPLCWGAYVLCIDSRLEPYAAQTPSPTTLLGRPAATPDVSSTPLPYPYEAVMTAATPLLAPSGCGTFVLCSLLPNAQRPTLPDETHSPSDVYSLFRSGKCASAMLTTGQVTAFSALTSAGKGFPFRTMVPDSIITDQVLLGSIVKGAEHSAAPQLLAFLTSQEAQQALTSQTLHTVRTDTKLYAAGVEGETESAARRSLTAINAFVSPQDVHIAAWQVYSGRLSMSEALLPLL